MKQLQKLSKIDNKDCMIVIPVYKQVLDSSEKISLFQCIKILGEQYEICLVYPESLDISYYIKISNGFLFNLLKCNDEYFTGTKSYSLLCENPEFYKEFSEYQYIMIYQPDGWIFENNLEYFLSLDYDYIGSPWPAGAYNCNVESVGNGGVSLRKVSKFIELCESINKYDLESKYAYAEDIFFCKYMKAIKKKIPFNIASVKDAVKFCFTINPGHFYSENNNKLPMCAHGWNIGYDFETFWNEYIPYNEYKNFTDFDYFTFAHKIQQNMKADENFIENIEDTKNNNTETSNNDMYEYNYNFIAPITANVTNNANCFDEYLSGKDQNTDIQMSTVDYSTSVCSKKNDYDDFIIVTLTTWKKRINNISYIIEDIMGNAVLPDKICINLAFEDFPNQENDFPDKLKQTIKKYEDTVEINWLLNNTKVWKKLIPTLCKYPDAVVISIDDDWKYPNDIIETLYMEYCNYDKKYPISGNKIRLFGMNCHCGSGSLTSYKLLNSKGQFNTLTKECIDAGSDDIFYSYCAYVNGNEYKQSPKQYFTNMKEFQNNDAYSNGAGSDINIAKTYEIAKKNYQNNIQSNAIDYICQNFASNDFLICIFNYKHDENAKKWLHMLKPYFETYVLDSGNDHEEKEFIQYPNIYYSGLFNEMKKLAARKNYKWIGQICSDAEIKDDNINALINNIFKLNNIYNIGIWQPGTDSTSRKSWQYSELMQENNIFLSANIIEGWMHFIRNSILDKIEYVNTSENLYGYGIDIYESVISNKFGYLNIVDNNIRVHNPNGTGYDNDSAIAQGNVYLKKLLHHTLDYYVKHYHIEKYNIDNSKITFVVPLRGRDEMRQPFEKNVEKYFPDYEIIYVVQNNDKPFMCAQLRNIGFIFAKTQYIAYRDIDVLDLNEIDLIGNYMKLGPYRTYDKRQQLSINADGSYKYDGSPIPVPGFGGYTVFDKKIWECYNGFTNLCIGWGYEDDMTKLRYELNTLERTFGHIKHPDNINTNIADTNINKEIYLQSLNGNINYMFDGYMQLAYDVISDEMISKNIREIKVDNIGVYDDYKYKDLLLQHKDALIKNNK